MCISFKARRPLGGRRLQTFETSRPPCSAAHAAGVSSPRQVLVRPAGAAGVFPARHICLSGDTQRRIAGGSRSSAVCPPPAGPRSARTAAVASTKFRLAGWRAKDPFHALRRWKLGKRTGNLCGGRRPEVAIRPIAPLRRAVQPDRGRLRRDGRPELRAGSRGGRRESGAPAPELSRAWL